MTTAIAVMLTGLLAASLLDTTEPPLIRFTIPVGEEAEVYLGGEQDSWWGRPSGTSLAISPGGEFMVYSAWEETPGGGRSSRLHKRRLDQELADPIAGTEGGSSPFFSPDGDWIGFYSGSSLRRVSVDDGTTETIVDVSEGLAGATWGDDGTIVYADGGTVFKVPSSGGEAQVVAEPDTVVGGYLGFAQPHLLPGSNALLFHHRRSPDPEHAETLALDLATGARTTVLTNAMNPRFIETGHLLFMRSGTLMAIAFDSDRLEVEGEPVAVMDDVMQAVHMPNTDWETGAAQLAVSPAGHLVYALGGVYPEFPREIVLVRRDEEATPIDLGPRRTRAPRVSPSGDRLAFGAGLGGGG